MTVRELIARLGAFDPGLPVVVPGGGAHYGASVEVGSVGRQEKAADGAGGYFDPGDFDGPPVWVVVLGP